MRGKTFKTPGEDVEVLCFCACFLDFIVQYSAQRSSSLCSTQVSVFMSPGPGQAAKKVWRKAIILSNPRTPCRNRLYTDFIFSVVIAIVIAILVYSFIAVCPCQCVVVRLVRNIRENAAKCNNLACVNKHLVNKFWRQKDSDKEYLINL